MSTSFRHSRIFKSYCVSRTADLISVARKPAADWSICEHSCHCCPQMIWEKTEGWRWCLWSEWSGQHSPKLSAKARSASAGPMKVCRTNSQPGVTQHGQSIELSSQERMLCWTLYTSPDLHRIHKDWTKRRPIQATTRQSTNFILELQA